MNNTSKSDNNLWLKITLHDNDFSYELEELGLLLGNIIHYYHGSGGYDSFYDVYNNRKNGKEEIEKIIKTLYGTIGRLCLLLRKGYGEDFETLDKDQKYLEGLSISIVKQSEIPIVANYEDLYIQITGYKDVIGFNYVV